MTRRRVLALAFLALPLPAFAGEGNGPNFPGAETPNIGISTTTFGPGGTVSHPGAPGQTVRTRRTHRRRHHAPQPATPS